VWGVCGGGMCGVGGRGGRGWGEDVKGGVRGGWKGAEVLSGAEGVGGGVVEGGGGLGGGEIGERRRRVRVGDGDSGVQNKKKTRGGERLGKSGLPPNNRGVNPEKGRTGKNIRKRCAK